MTAKAVVHLFTDIEGSTSLWERDPERMDAALQAHDAILKAAVESHRGRVVKWRGDGVHAAFNAAADAVGAMVAVQRALAQAREPALRAWPLRARSGVHQGVDAARGGDYYGRAVNTAARLMSAAAGGQMLVSCAVAEALAPEALPPGVSLQPLGAVRLRGVTQPLLLHQVSAPPLHCDFPPLRALADVPHNLPAALNPFIAREAELAQLQDALRAHRLVTLHGTGGVGKTRLLQELARAVLSSFADGVWWVELAPLSQGAGTAQAVATVLGVREEGARPLAQVIAQQMQGREVMLVLDNCEHVLADAAALGKALLLAWPQLRIVASSREVLRVAGEFAFPVAPLALPQAAPAAAEAPAVRLFVDRAQAAAPRWQPQPQDWEPIAQICRQLDGLPLAIELAAARVRQFAVAEIAQRLKSGLGFLSTRDETVTARQRTMERLVDWSHAMLSDAERALWRRLSVFAGGWTLRLAEEVCAGDEALAKDDAAELLGALVDKSLVVPDLERGRWHLLETMRGWLRPRLQGDERLEVCRRHAQSLTSFAEHARPLLQAGGRQAIGWMRRMDSERDNLEAALVFAAQDEVSAALALRLFSAQLPYWVNRGLLSAGRAAAEVLANSSHVAAAPVLQRAVALGGAGQLCNLCGDSTTALRYLTEACALLESIDELARLARVLQPLGAACSALGRHEEAERHFARALELSRRTAQQQQEVSSLVALAMLRRIGQQPMEAEALYGAALALCPRQEQAASRAMILLNLAMLQIDRGDEPAARTSTLETLDLLGEVVGPIHAIGALDVARAIAVTNADATAALRWDAGAQYFCDEAKLRRDGADQEFADRWRARLPRGQPAAAWSEDQERNWVQQLAQWLHGSAATTTR
jgi:predicted ATPase/class 3 adenylate cyclase